MNPVSIFIAYSHNDLRYKDELKKFLRPLLNTRQATVWDDYDIEAGKDWEAEIKTRLYGADIILLLVSPDSLASDYFYGQEVAVSLERHEKGEAVVAPIILRPCPWTITPLKRIEAMPEKGKPITSWASQDEAFTDVAHRIGNIVERIQQEKQTLGQREFDRRQYEAAVNTAEHLFKKNSWAEAQKAFTEALSLHQIGFVPDSEVLRQRLEASKNSEEQAAEDRASEDRKSVFSQALVYANGLFSQEKWTEALDAYRAAERLYEPGFPLPPGTTSLQDRIDQCEAELRQVAAAQTQERQREQQYRQYIGETEKNLRRRAYAQAVATADQALQIRPGDAKAKRLKEEAENGLNNAPVVATTTNNRNLLWGGVGLAALLMLIVLFLVFGPFGPGRNRDNKSDQPEKKPESTEMSVSNNPGQQAFEKARTANTIPALDSFLLAYPNDSNAAEARRLKSSLENRRDNYLKDASAFLRVNRYKDARGNLQNARDLDPTNVEIRQKLESLEMGAPTNTVQKAYEKARTSNTIPALQSFLQAYPNDNNAAEAKRLKSSLENRRDNHLKDAAAYLRVKRYKDARENLQKARDLDPNNVEIKQKLESLKNK